jgi:hypothetical protein
MTQSYIEILRNLSDINALIGYATNAPIGEKPCSKEWHDEFFRKINAAAKAVDQIAVIALGDDRNEQRKEAIRLLDSK